MQEFLQQLVFGLSIGSVYGSLALALVLIHRATGIVNFAQGEMAMFTTFIAWSLITNHGFSFWPAFFVTLAIAFVIGVGVERVVIRPFYRASPLTIILVTIALFVIFNGLAAWIWSPETRVFPARSARSRSTSAACIARQDVGMLVVTLDDRARCCGRFSASPASASRCGPPRSARRRAGCSASASAGCSPAAGASRPSSAPSPG